MTNISQPQVSPVPDSVVKKFNEFEKRKMQLMSMDISVQDQQVLEEDDIESGSVFSPLLDINVTFDEKMVMNARLLLNAEGNNVVLPHGGYIVGK